MSEYERWIEEGGMGDRCGRDGERVLVTATVNKRGDNGDLNVTVDGNGERPGSAWVGAAQAVPLYGDDLALENAALRIALARARELVDGLPGQVARDVVRALDFPLHHGVGERIREDYVSLNTKIANQKETLRADKLVIRGLRGTVAALSEQLRLAHQVVALADELLLTVEAGHGVDLTDSLLSRLRAGIQAVRKEGHQRSRTVVVARKHV